MAKGDQLRPRQRPGCQRICCASRPRKLFAFGLCLFRKNRLIEGSGEEGYRPPLIFGTSGSSSYARLRLFGELHLEGFEVSHTKDGFRWDENEEPFVELLKDHLDSDELPLLRQCENYRSLASKKDRGQAATKALDRTGDVLADTISSVLPVVAEKTPVETQSEPLPAQPSLAVRELRFDFKGEPWLVRIELTDDPGEGDWLSISDPGVSQGGPIRSIFGCQCHILSWSHSRKLMPETSNRSSASPRRLQFLRSWRDAQA